MYLSSALADPLRDFFVRHRSAGGLILALIFLYRVPDFVLNIMNPFYLDLGYSLVEIAEVRKIFNLSKGLPVAGCMVSNGRIARGKVRVQRRKHVIYEGTIQSLRRFQDEVQEVRAEVVEEVPKYKDCLM